MPLVSLFGRLKNKFNTFLITCRCSAKFKNGPNYLTHYTSSNALPVVCECGFKGKNLHEVSREYFFNIMYGAKKVTVRFQS